MADIVSLYGQPLAPQPAEGTPRQNLAVFFRGIADAIDNGTIAPDRAVVVLSGEVAVTIQDFNLTRLETLGLIEVVRHSMLHATP